MSTQRHQPAGQPSGGQFMTTAHSESAVSLGDPDSRGPLTLGPMDYLDPTEQGVVRTRMGELREAGLTGRATEFEVVEGDRVSLRLLNPAGNFIVSVADDSFGVVRSRFNPTDPAHEWSADALVSVDPQGGGRITNRQIADTYTLAMTKSVSATRFAERSGLRSGGNVRFGLPELRKDEWGRPVGALDITMDVETGGAITYTVFLPRGKDKVEAYNHEGALLTPRMTKALLEEATEEGGGPAGTDLVSNAIPVTLLEEGETW